MISKRKTFWQWLRGFLWRLSLFTLWPIYGPVVIGVIIVVYAVGLVIGIGDWLFTGNNNLLKSMID